MTSMPEWMKCHVRLKGTFATVDFRVSKIKARMDAEDKLYRSLGAQDIIVLYATPMVIAVQCEKVIGLLREQLILSHIDEGEDIKRKGQRMTDIIKRAQDALDEELARITHFCHKDKTFEEWLRSVADVWFDEVACKLIETWRNAYSAILMKRKWCNHNENLHEFLSYALVVRALANEAMDCEKDIKTALDKKLQGTGVNFVLHGSSPVVKLLTAANVICDRFGLPKHEELMDDLQVRRCQDNWERSVGNVMKGILDAKEEGCL